MKPHELRTQLGEQIFSNSCFGFGNLRHKRCQSPRLSFAVKIIAVTMIADAIGIAIFAVGQRRRCVAVT
jgi:hypothetical protein